ncbi:hypothetical protein [Pseudanabaena sp. PCC 6802]|uniref:hypothetical protein n=1 Tax=Pseudanabaena sp. PCC 6802 TaxID=118173 RepID=UPI00034BB6CE|nr:hypothetical protein [Pseudanabaena sp. PCC 6802]
MHKPKSVDFGQGRGKSFELRNPELLAAHNRLVVERNLRDWGLANPLPLVDGVVGKVERECYGRDCLKGLLTGEWQSTTAIVDALPFADKDRARRRIGQTLGLMHRRGLVEKERRKGFRETYWRLKRMNLSTLNVPEYARTAKPDGVIYEAQGSIRYRFDGSDGQFYVGSYATAEKLIAQPFAYRWDEGERWGRRKQSWLDLAFVDWRNAVCVASFKNDSAVNIFDFLVGAKNEAVRLEALRLTICGSEVPVRTLAEPEEDFGVIEIYYAAEVAEVQFASREQMATVQAFAESGQFMWHLVGEV